MIQLIPVDQIKSCKHTLKAIYLDSFPPDERRDWNKLLEITLHSHFNLYCILNTNVPVGLITLWKWSEFTFIEHFAIDNSFRGRGIGSEVLNQLKQDVPAKIILETEEPDTDIAKRRIDFYTGLGFHLCQEDYYQPAYSQDKKAVKMYLMSYPEMISHSEFITIKDRLYKEVYQVNSTEFPSV